MITHAYRQALMARREQLVRAIDAIKAECHDLVMPDPELQVFADAQLAARTRSQLQAEAELARIDAILQHS